MAISDKLVKIVQSKGWPAIASLFFDNGLGIEVFNSRGYVAINPNEGVVYNTSVISRRLRCTIWNVYSRSSLLITLIGIILRMRAIRCLCQRFRLRMRL